MLKLFLACIMAASAAISHAQATNGGVPGGSLTSRPPAGINVGAPAQLSYATNVSPYLMPHWISCSAKVKANSGYCRVFAVGDSTTYGLCSNAVGGNACTNSGDLTTAAYPTRLAQYMNTTVLPANRDTVMGAASGSAGQGPCASNDARVSCGAWTTPLVYSFGGDMFEATSAATFTFTPTDQVDTFVLWYIQSAGAGGTGSYQIDSGSATTFSEVAPPTKITSVTATTTLGSHTFKVNWVSGTIYIVGVEAYNSAVGSVRIANGGVPGVTSSFYANNANQWAPQSAVVTMAPDVVLLDLGINDWNTAVSVATYTANMQQLITAWLVNSDVVLVTPVPSANATVALTTQVQYINALYSLAATNNIPIIDNWSRWGSAERVAASPYLLYPTGYTLHPDAWGYSDFAGAIANSLLSVAGGH